MDRRQFLAASSAAALAGPKLATASVTKPDLPTGKADHCIFIWLGGGMAQMDTFDPKDLGDNKGKPKVPGSMYPSIPTAVPGVRVCEHLSKTAKLMDRVTAMRTVTHRVIDEHAFATNLVHTGRMISGTVTYPSIGSLVAQQRPSDNPNVPSYMLIGYPNVSRGPGFLGAKYSPVYLVDTESGPAGFTRPEDVNSARAARREGLLKPINSRIETGSNVSDYAEAQVEALRLAGPEFMKNFNLNNESAKLRESYGGEFGQRCLLARRLIQDGVRFIEVSHNLNFLNGAGWDVHNDGIDNQHLLIQELDTALSALITDLESKKMLDKTLIVIATEFGRPPEFDGGGGRGHQGTTFTMVYAGGGLKHRGAYGVSDELSKKVLENPVPIPDFHATILWSLGINPANELYDGARPIPITDEGKPVAALFG